MRDLAKRVLLVVALSFCHLLGPGVATDGLLAAEESSDTALVAQAREDSLRTPAEPRDSLEILLDGLRRQTDERFGEATVLDTVGLDSLLERRLLEPATGPNTRDRYLQPNLVMRYNRAEGPVLGMGFDRWSRRLGTISAGASYAFNSKLVLHDVGWKRIFWLSSPYGFQDRRDVSRDWNQPGVSLFGIRVRYARETALFAPEHSQKALSTLNAFFLGTDRQSYFERRGVDASLRLRLAPWDFAAGFRTARERPYERNATFSVFGSDDESPGVTLADAGDFHSLRGRAAWLPASQRYAAALEGQGLGNDGWRLRGVLGGNAALGRSVKAYAQIEGGAADPASPRQRKFELGGPRAVASLPFGTGGTDHLLLGKLELIHSESLLELLHLPRPDFFDLQLGAFLHYGVAWDDPAGREVVFSKPPSNAWKGTAGLSLAYRPGLPDPRTFWRFQFGWPVGPEAGDFRITLAIGREFDLVGNP